MNSKIFFVLILILAGVVIFGMTAKSRQEISAISSSNTTSTAQTSPFAPQTKTMGAVEVEVKPVSIEREKDMVFELSMNTHSVELNYDYTQIATLTDDFGNSYKPKRWTGGSSGHHLSGQLIFAPLAENPKKLTLTVDGVDNKVESFSWQL